MLRSGGVFEHCKAAHDWLIAEGFSCRPGYGATRRNGNGWDRAWINEAAGKAVVTIEIAGVAA